MVRVFAGRAELTASAGVYKVPLRANGAWIVAGELEDIERALPRGAYLVARLGRGAVLQGLFGYMQRSKVYMNAH